ncbi:perlucin-like [Haliotis asinina]|uniref:perlucin-like n=1 Tax=Haliotis asinina TaxID=109174 RepID=UPI0035325121
MKFGFITLLLTYLVNLESCLVKRGFGNKWENFTNVIITTDVLSEVSNIGSNVECVSLCLMNEACVSAFYRPQHRRCQLHDVLFMSPQDGQEEPGTMYYSLTTGTCPSDYIHNRLLSFCYQLHFDKASYQESLADCSSRGEHLVTIDSPDKQSHFVKQATASSDTKAYSYYIDGSDADTEGQWVYNDGRPVTYFAWAPGYPKNSTVSTDYLMAHRYTAFRWQDKGPAPTRAYVCEKYLS